MYNVHYILNLKMIRFLLWLPIQAIHPAITSKKHSCIYLPSPAMVSLFLGPRAFDPVHPSTRNNFPFFLLLLLLLLFLLLLLLMSSPPPNPRGDSCCCCCCKWSSGGAGLLQMIILRGRALANDHPEGSSSMRRNWGFQLLHENWLFVVKNPFHNT